MAQLNDITGAEAYNWDEEGIYQLEVSDPVQAGPGGISNLQAKLLATRTRNLHLRLSAREVWDINTILGGVATELDTLEKLRAHFENLIESIEVGGVDVATIYSTIRGGVDAAYDTLEKLKAYIDTEIGEIETDWSEILNVPTFKGKTDLAGTTIDWSGEPEIRKTLTQNEEFGFSNLIEGKTIGFRQDGGFQASFVSAFKLAAGSPTPDPAKVNYIQMRCINATAGSEEIVYSVIFIG